MTFVTEFMRLSTVCYHYQTIYANADSDQSLKQISFSFLFLSIELRKTLVRIQVIGLIKMAAIHITGQI